MTRAAAAYIASPVQVAAAGSTVLVARGPRAVKIPEAMSQTAIPMAPMNKGAKLGSLKTSMAGPASA